MPSLDLLRYQQAFARLGQRRLLLLAGSYTWQREQLRAIQQQCKGDWLILSSEMSEAIKPEHAHQLLGREYLHAVFDANHAFNADALAMLTGTLKAGSWLILCLPDIVQWQHYIDNDSQRWNDAQGVISTPHFMAWLAKITLADKQAIIWQASQPLVLPEIKNTGQQWALPQGMPTIQQRQLLANLLQAKSGVWSITAPRGRGKSALAGMLIEQWPGSVTVCAPARNSIEVLLSHTHKTIKFYSPDNLLALCHTEHLCRDWLIIDEAATIPIAQLIALCQHFPRVLMTTTVQGYEGTGRGFILKLGDSIPKLQNYQLTVPIRWAQDDPLENWLNQLLLLDEPSFHHANQSGEVVITSCQHFDSEQRANFYQLLTSAHYRTTPLDLRRLFDGQKQHYWSAFIHRHLVGAVWCIEEGGLAKALAQDVWRGIRRPRGNLVAQSLVTYGLSIEAMCLTSLRISRIAVLPAYRRQKVAAKLVADIAKQCQKQSIDYLSVSFGYTDALANFWQQCGFYLVRLGVHKEASSGCYTAMAIYPISAQGQQLLQVAQQALALQSDYITQQTGISLATALPSASEADHWLMMAGFAFAHRSILTVYQSVGYFLQGDRSRYPLLVAFFIDKQSIEACVKQFSLSGKKALVTTLRRQCQQLMAEKDEQLAQAYQHWLTTTSSGHFCWANRPHHPIYH